MRNDLEILNEMLLGEFIFRFSVGDTWEMYIGNICLSAHNLEFENERLTTEFLQANYHEFNYSVDKEDVSKATIMASNLRKPITRVSLDEMKNLTIDFEKGSSLKILTNTDIVDWQWCISRSHGDPYADHEIACFWAGDVQLKE